MSLDVRDGFSIRRGRLTDQNKGAKRDGLVQRVLQGMAVSLECVSITSS